MDRIITPQQIQKSVVKIVYKEKEQGTGFFITPNIILTTYHVFLEEKIISLFLDYRGTPYQQ